MSASPEYGYPDLPGFDKRNRELVYAMCDAGWTGRRTSKGHWLGKAPDGTTSITVPSKDGNNRGLKNSHAVFMRWLRDHMPAEERDLFDKAKAEDDPLIKDTLAESLVKKQATRVMQERDERIHQEAVRFVKEMQEAGSLVIEPLIRPWLARKSPGKDGGTRYESQAVLERVWPDGFTDYTCALPGCEYVSKNPVSVARHYGAAHTRKGADRAEVGPVHPDPTYTEPVSTRDYRPTQRLVDALASFLTEHSWDNTDELALLMLTWAHDRPDIDHEPRPLVPLTDRQVLDKIRMLVGQPDQTDEIDALRRRVAELEGDVTRLTEERRALRDLLSDDGV